LERIHGQPMFLEGMMDSIIIIIIIPERWHFSNF